MRKHRHIIAALALVTFFFVGGLGMFAISGMDHHHMTGCPFMPGEQAICQMDAFDHITAWQNAFTAVVPSFVVLLLVALVLYISFRWLDHPPNATNKIHLRVGNIRIKIPNLYQELFSNGILNPKIP